MSKYQHTKGYISKNKRFDVLFEMAFNEFYLRQHLAVAETSRRMGITSSRFKNEAKRLGLVIARRTITNSFGRITQPDASQKARRVLRKLGFVIPDGYEIHHRDGNRDNNDPENLMIVTHVQHSWIHLRLGLSEPDGDD